MKIKKYQKTFKGQTFELYCVDNKCFLEKFLNIKKPDLFFFSPPYNIGSNSDVKITNRRIGGYDSKSFRGITDYKDNMSEYDYQQNQIFTLNTCSVKLNDGGCIIYNHKNRYKNNRIISPLEWIFKTKLELSQEIIWDRKSTHENGRTHPRPVDERLYALTNKWNNTFYAPKFANRNELMNPSTIWRINKQAENIHNAAFPLELAREVVKYYCKPNGVVSDIYSGSGTTMIASLLEGKNFVGCELLETNFYLSIERFENIIKNNNG